MDAAIEYALGLPAAILIRVDERAPDDPINVSNYEVAIQQPRQHRRFASFFRDGGSLMMYFKHDPSTIADLYQRFPGVILPSEIATKYWSKIRVDQAPAMAAPLAESSHRLIHDAATKQGRKMIEESGPGPNRFLTFHRTAVELAQRANTSVRYNDHDEPAVLIGSHPAVKFSWNRLAVQVPGDVEGTCRWEILEPVDFAEWPGAMRAALT